MLSNIVACAASLAVEIPVANLSKLVTGESSDVIKTNEKVDSMKGVDEAEEIENSASPSGLTCSLLNFF